MLIYYILALYCTLLMRKVKGIVSVGKHCSLQFFGHQMDQPKMYVVDDVISVMVFLLTCTLSPA